MPNDIRHKILTTYYYRFNRVRSLGDGSCYVVFTFDTEEDWQGNDFLYYRSYKYIDSGIFYQLIDGLQERNIRGTFYITVNIARERPRVLKYLEEHNQTIGVHFHVHSLNSNCNYPYKTDPEDEITAYSYSDKVKSMRIAKRGIESVVGHEVFLYRSGRLACDYETEKAAKQVGFEAISNHRGIYYIYPHRIWNLGVGTCDLLDFDKFSEVGKYIDLFKEQRRNERLVIFCSHPMLLYDHASNSVVKEGLSRFFEFLDYLRVQDYVRIIDQYTLLKLIEKQKGLKNKMCTYFTLLV